MAEPSPDRKFLWRHAGVQLPSPASLPPPPTSAFLEEQTPFHAGSNVGESMRVQSNTGTRPNEEALVKRENGDYDNAPWGPETQWSREIQQEYDAFLDAERGYVMGGNWERFPVGSRLFIGKCTRSLMWARSDTPGNLSSDKVTKRDLFHVFHRHGQLAQISIKQAYGFVQYLDAASCARAMTIEQGVSIRGKAISKFECYISH